MVEEQSSYGRAKKTKLTVQLTDDTLELARLAYEKFKNSHLDGEDWSKESFDEFIDDMVFSGVDNIASAMQRYELEMEAMDSSTPDTSIHDSPRTRP